MARPARRQAGWCPCKQAPGRPRMTCTNRRSNRTVATVLSVPAANESPFFCGGRRGRGARVVNRETVTRPRFEGPFPSSLDLVQQTFPYPGNSRRARSCWGVRPEDVFVPCPPRPNHRTSLARVASNSTRGKRIGGDFYLNVPRDAPEGARSSLCSGLSTASRQDPRRPSFPL